ncbi:hypothetical protein VTO73DRAFT_15111 [Trametes versicolor]
MDGYSDLTTACWLPPALQLETCIELDSLTSLILSGHDVTRKFGSFTHHASMRQEELDRNLVHCPAVYDRQRPQRAMFWHGARRRSAAVAARSQKSTWPFFLRRAV